MVPKFHKLLINLRTILGSILGPKAAPKGDQKRDQFWNPPTPVLRGPKDAKPGTKQECCKSYWSWKYILQKNGRDILIYIYVSKSTKYIILVYCV